MANLPFYLKPGEAERLREKYPERIPVLLFRGAKIDPAFPHLQKNKFLVPRSLTLGMFSYVVRKQLTLPPEKALFLFVGNSLPTTGSLISDLYHHYKNDDGALHVIYMSESAFG
jgi:GABA(A) receptor-associated protein